MKLVSTIIKAAGSVILATLFSFAQATPLTPNASLGISGQGVSFSSVGIGLESGGTGTINIDIGGDVISATLYWIGRDFMQPYDCAVPVPPAGAFDELKFDGTAIKASRVTGCETNFDSNNIGYAADVTAIVKNAGIGPQSFSVETNDPAPGPTWNGAGLLVIYTDPSDTTFYAVTVAEGLDFAYIYGSAPDAIVTEPVTFNYAGAGFDRTASMGVYAGDAEADRPDRVQIDTTAYLNDLDANAGGSFDDDIFAVPVLAGADSTTIQLFSATNSELPSALPDSLLWQLGVLRVPENAIQGRMTGGRNLRVDGAHVRGSRGGFTIHCDITLSNNIQVSWPGGNTWHLDKPIDKATCIDAPDIDPTPPAAPFDTFIGEAVGKLNGVDGSEIRFTFIDDGEPGRTDWMKIEIWDVGDIPGVDPVFITFEGYLDGGNIQAHYDQPHK
jgi:hypothetical protein